VPSRMITVAAAQLRGSPPQQLARILRGDLDTVLLKALGKQPESRYPTADAFAQELQRYSRGEPIQARAAGPWYRARKFLGRNKLASSLSGALLVALVTGLGAALWEAHAARVEARRAESVQKFLVGIFSQSDPEHARGKNITAGEILEGGAARLDTELRDEPRMLGELHHVIADIYSALGDNVDALVHADRAVALLGRQGSPEYLDSLSLRAQSFDEEEQWDKSTAAFKELRRAAHQALGADSQWDVVALRGLAWAATQQGNLKEAKQLYDEALTIALRVSGERSVSYLKTLGSSIQADLDLGLLDEAQAAATKVISLGSSVPDYTLTDLLVDRYQLASILFRKRLYQQALQQLNLLVPDMDRTSVSGMTGLSKPVACAHRCWRRWVISSTPWRSRGSTSNHRRARARATPSSSRCSSWWLRKFCAAPVDSTKVSRRHAAEPDTFIRNTHRRPSCASGHAGFLATCSSLPVSSARELTLLQRHCRTCRHCKDAHRRQSLQTRSSHWVMPIVSKVTLPPRPTTLQPPAGSMTAC